MFFWICRMIPSKFELFEINFPRTLNYMKSTDIRTNWISSTFCATLWIVWNQLTFARLEFRQRSVQLGNIFTFSILENKQFITRRYFIRANEFHSMETRWLFDVLVGYLMYVTFRKCVADIDTRVTFQLLYVFTHERSSRNRNDVPLTFLSFIVYLKIITNLHTWNTFVSSIINFK